MRIVAGTHGGRRIAAPRGRGTRPTPERVREALFSILGPLEGVAVLDLFAGSGALGLEALSRGATSATFVDSGSAAVRTIRANLSALDLEHRGRVLRADWRRAVAGEARSGRLYGVVLIDPPYAMTATITPQINEIVGPVLDTDALVVIEHAALVGGLGLEGVSAVRTRRFGDTALTIISAERGDA